MTFLKRIQDQPKYIRKIIFWIIIITLGIIFLFAWFQGLKARLEQAKQEKAFEQLKPPGLEEELESFPKVEMPEFPELTEEEIKQLEEMLKESEQRE